MSRLGLALGAFGALAVGLAPTSVTAVDDATIRLVSSPSGDSTATDALPVELLTFGLASNALDARPASGASITLPTTIGALTGTVITDVSAATHSATASISFTGRTSSIFGQTHASPVDVLVLVDWDESDATDEDPRVIVSAQPPISDVGQLIGMSDPSLATDLPVGVATYTATDRPDPSIATGGIAAMVPSAYPASVRTYLGRIGGIDLDAPFRIPGAIAVHAGVDAAALGPVVEEASGMVPGDEIVLTGALPTADAVAPSPGAGTIAGIALHAEIESFTLPDEIRSHLALGASAAPGRLDVAATDGGTPLDPSDDELALRLSTTVSPAAPLPTAPVDVTVDLAADGATQVLGVVGADIGRWSAPFGSAPFSVTDARLSGTISGPRVAGAVRTEVAIVAESTFGGSARVATVAGDLRSPLDATVTIDIDGTISLAGLLRAVEIDVGGIIPAHVLDAEVGPGSLTLRATGSASSPTIVTSFDGRVALQIQPDVGTTVGATVFVETSNDGADATVAIRPDTDLMLSDLVPGAKPDFALNSGGSAIGFVFSSAGLDTTRGELSDAARRFFGPLFLDGDATEVKVLPGASTLGLVRLPSEVAGFLRNSLGIEPTARFSGTIPAGAGSNFNFLLALDVDPTFAPEWVESAGLSLEVNAGSAGVGVNLKGSLTARFRAGIDPTVAAELADLGIDVASDEPVAADHQCRGAAKVLEIPAAGGGTEFRCFDSLTFTVGSALTINPTNVTADLSFTLDAAVMGADHGWQPFGLSWIEINRLRLEVGVQWDALAAPPGVALTMGMSGDVTIGGKDLFAAIRLTATPIPAPPFVKIELDGFRLSSDAGFEIDDFFSLQHDLAVSAAELAGVDPATVPPPFRMQDLGIPNIALRNLDLSFSLTGATTLCIPQGLHISADLYVNPTGEPTVRGPKCDDTGAPIPPPVGSTCPENQDRGCLAGGRIALTIEGFNADLDLSGFDLGPLQFRQSKLDLKIEPLESHLIMFGGVALDPIGQGQMQMSIQRSGLATTASFAGLVEIGPAGSPFITALAEGTAGFDPAEIQRTGIDFRFVLNAEGLDIDTLTATLETNARTAIQQSAQAIVDFVNGIDRELTAFTNDPAGYVNTQLAAVGVTIPASLQPLIDGIAELAAEGVTATEDMILRGQLGGAPAGGADKVPQCSGIQFLGSDDRCYDVLPVPSIEGVAKQTVCVAPNLIEVDGRCYTVPPVTGEPAGGVAPVSSCPPASNILAVQLSGGRCYTILPDTNGSPDGGVTAARDFDGNAFCPPLSNVLALTLSGGRCYEIAPNNGTPSGGVAPDTTCPVLQPFASGGRCYTIAPSSGAPSGGAAKQTVCVFPNVQERGDRCYSILATPAGGDAPIGQVCAVPTPFEGTDGRCYVVPPVDTVGLCDAFGALPDVDLPSNCTRRQFFDEVVVPAIYAASTFTQEVVSQTLDILSSLPTLEIDCMEFRLTLDRSTTNVTMSITAGIGGDVKTFGLGWDLQDDVATNLVGLLDGIRGGAPTGCAPIDLLDFADEVIGTDGGELLKPSIPVSDSVVLPEGSTQLLFPFANDGNASTSIITGLDLQVVTIPIPIVTSPLAAPMAFAAAPPTASAGGVDAQTQPDLRSIRFTSNDDLPPGGTRLLSLRITSVNSSGVSTQSTTSVVLTGTDNAPVAVLDTAVLDLRIGTDVDIDVLANDTDAEDGRPAGLAVADGAGATGCPVVDAGQVRYDGQGCDGSAAFAALADGETVVDTFGYTATDSAGNAAAGAVEVTVTGRNDAPTVGSLRAAPQVDAPGETFVATAVVDDPDAGDLLTVAIDWGDGSTESLTDVIPGARLRAPHVYTGLGTYTVEVIVTDRAGSSTSSTTRVAVRELATLTLVDADGDGFDASIDCRDFDPTVFPGATEILDNGVDENCNGDADGVSAPAVGGPGDGGGGDGGTPGGNGAPGSGGGDTPGTGSPTDPGSGQNPISPNLPQTGGSPFGMLHLGALVAAAGLALTLVAWRRRVRIA